jgi:hypothetical protein
MSVQPEMVRRRAGDGPSSGFDSGSLAQRLIGAIFVEKGHISEEQLVLAVEEQRATGQKLGEILITRCGLSRLDLAGALAERWAEEEAAMVSEPRVERDRASAHDDLRSRLAAVEARLATVSTELVKLRRALTAGTASGEASTMSSTPPR